MSRIVASLSVFWEKCSLDLFMVHAIGASAAPPAAIGTHYPSMPPALQWVLDFVDGPHLTPDAVHLSLLPVSRCKLMKNTFSYASAVTLLHTQKLTLQLSAWLLDLAPHPGRELVLRWWQKSWNIWSR